MLKNRPRLMLIALALTTSLLTGCEKKPPETRIVPNYTPEQTERIIEDGRTCGPAAQDALFDLCVMIDC